MAFKDFFEFEVKKLTYFEMWEGRKKDKWMHIFIDNPNGGVDKYLLAGFKYNKVTGRRDSYEVLSEIVEKNGW